MVGKGQAGQNVKKITSQKEGELDDMEGEKGQHD